MIHKTNLLPTLRVIGFILLLSCCSILKTAAQSKPLDSVMVLLDRNDIPELQLIVEENDVTSLKDRQLALYHLANGSLKFSVDDYVDAYADLLEAKKSSSDQYIIFKCNEFMMQMNNSNNELQIAPESIMEENLAIATALNEPKLLVKSKFYFMFKDIQLGNYEKAKKLCYEMKKICIDNNMENELIDTEFNLGTLHYYLAKNDSALFYYQKNLEDVKKKKDTLNIATRLNNLAMLQLQIGQEQKAVNNLITAQELVKDRNDAELNVGLLRNIADAQTAAGNYKEAIDYYNQFISEEDSLERGDIAQNLKELQTKYETSEKELENAELRAENLSSSNKIYLLLFILASLMGIGAYFFNRMQQKQAILAADAEAQKQREEKLLKDQELASIDAMITGQEKERKKIAQDLHDDVGSSLTTARMCVENVISKTEDSDSKNTLENAYALLNDTYSKVRHISHTQKSSVLSKHGLVGTLNQLAERINSAQSLEIEIVHHGLEGRLSNSMELGLFRMIQELINNTVKHAQATQASVILTGYDDHVNIIVEDNGKGFEVATNNSNGTGLYSIYSRVENLDGTIEIDSVIGAGTTTNIEIPLK